MIELTPRQLAEIVSVCIAGNPNAPDYSPQDISNIADSFELAFNNPERVKEVISAFKLMIKP